MCILFVAVNQHKDYPLIIAANRDEFFKRETAESHLWHIGNGIIAGKDLQAGGTWMGINKQGYIASLTNVRDPQKISADAITRGELATHYLQKPDVNYQQILRSSKDNYNGYNLLFGKWNELAVYNNHLDQIQQLSSGYYGLSNASLNSPWPKINKGVAKLEEYCQDGHDINPEVLFNLLLDKTLAADEDLPQTGVPIDWERRLSSIFILGEDYGTRSSTVLKVDKQQNVDWYERTYDNTATCTSSQSFHFSIN
ncbi:NRDE family protein [uncultured Paraglaciecola sp.]|uniref:NRDE family protein n=1 Tax=uncultured Paraglaciecola sp. TaxID=1765024 RepID=UPI0030DC3280|tara:strand:+ start:8956 stop:9717 length:762 start_codon:yes stop_codon:yes gene_type:complete